MTRVMQKKTTQKLIVQTLTGAAFGAAGTFLFLRFGGKVADFDDPSRLAAAATGIIYALMGLFVGLGAIVPGAGAKFLNVEDADEILAERKSIGPGAIGCLLIGLLLMALSLTPGGGSPGGLSPDAAMAIAAVCVGGLLLVGWWVRGKIDEFNQRLGIEASALAMHLSLLLFGGWAALAHVGYVQWITPLGLLAGFALLELGAIFWVVGKRGLLVPR
jgi:membrane associated rhomboid family serine protease